MPATNLCWLLAKHDCLQIGFINIIVKPTFTTLQQILPKLSVSSLSTTMHYALASHCLKHGANTEGVPAHVQVCMEDLERNLEFWTEEKEKASQAEDSK